MSIQCENIAVGESAEYTWHSPGMITNVQTTSIISGQFYSGRDITGMAYGASNSFCDFPASAYRTGAFAGIWKFSIVQNGASKVAYCLEKGVRGADGNPYASVSVEESSVPLTQRQQMRIAYILTNAIPVISAGQQFANAGVSSSQAPALDENDAYAAAQVAIWSVINEPADRQTGWSFYNCSDGEPHPKSDRLRAAIAYLFDQSEIYANTRPEEPAAEVPPCCKFASVEGATLLSCAEKHMRMECGKWLYGPFMVRSNAPFSLFLTPICEPECMRGFITLTDACGSAILTPAAGQEFYVAFPPSIEASCYQMSIAVAQTIVDVVIMENTDAPPHLQTLIFTPRCRQTLKSAALCFCVAPPAAPELRAPEKQFPFCFINNNRAVSNSGVREDERRLDLEVESDVTIQNQRSEQSQGNRGRPSGSRKPERVPENKPEAPPKPPAQECEPPKIPYCPCPETCLCPCPAPCPPAPCDTQCRGVYPVFKKCMW